MINTKELRVGNLVMVNGDYIGKVESVAAEGINGVLYGDFDMGYDEAEGIPITEEWLEKMGCIIGNHQRAGKMWSFVIQGSAKRNLSLVRMTPSRFLAMVTGQGEEACLNDLRYVHQLQNLYFALTGNELSIK